MTSPGCIERADEQVALTVNQFRMWIFIGLWHRLRTHILHTYTAIVSLACYETIKAL
jgi:hypothetical protein